VTAPVKRYLKIILITLDPSIPGGEAMRRHPWESKRSSESQTDRYRAATPAPCVAIPAIAIALLLLGACTVGEGNAAEHPAGSRTRARQGAAEAHVQGAAVDQKVDWTQVDRAMGRTGKMQDDGAYKYSMPRGDLHVTVDGVAIEPALSLGSWLAMKPAANGVVAMGDLVLKESEVTPVIVKLQEGGVMQTALHNHLLRESPRVMYLHVHGEGDPVKIAETIHAALGATSTPPESPRGSEVSRPLGIDTAAIDRALGRGGSASGGVYHVAVPRAETIHAAGVDVTPSMGTATSINFQPTGSGRAAVNGDFVMTADEVNEVIHALEEGGIEVVAVHNHMLHEEPRLFFLHYWANDDAVKLARALRAALDETNARPAHQ
jgi:hypothetical protein